MGVPYTATWNMLDFPAGVLPFGTESGSKVDEYDDRGDYYFKLAKEVSQANCHLIRSMHSFYVH